MTTTCSVKILVAVLGTMGTDDTQQFCWKCQEDENDAHQNQRTVHFRYKMQIIKLWSVEQMIQQRISKSDCVLLWDRLKKFTPHNCVMTVLLLLLLFSGAHCDICSLHMTQDKMLEVVHASAIPKGGVSAGHYIKDIDDKDLTSCILSCCNKETCDVAFLYDDTCYLIECNTTVPWACDPLYQKDSKYNNTYLVIIRPMDSTVSSRPLSNLPSDCFIEDICDDQSEECQIAVLDDELTATCVCKNDYIPDPNSGVCVSIREAIWGDDIIRTCEFGVRSHCQTNEFCYIPKGSRKLIGTCQCLPGYERNRNELCEIKIVSDLEKKSGSGTPQPAFIATSRTTDGVAMVKGITTAPPIGSTMHPFSTTVKLIKLEVSAGDTKVIQLPKNSVTLSAFVLPNAKEDQPYQYEWILVDSPENAESGTMQGKNKDTLKLSNLIAGLYTFKIKVTGTNRFGEAQVNVTVLQPTRNNTLPVAIIKPSKQEVKLPNSAILDGSGSTDDDKIISYHWEEVSGPLQDHTITEDTAMLTLSDLVPGKYTFKLTVTDSDGATNSSSANVTVIKETDYRPNADAGSDVIIFLPQNSIILYGNASTDDKVIASYEWIQSTKDSLATDVMGVRTPFLHLSNLEQGDYRFTLKVTDTAGQTSEASVNVFVKPAEKNHPPSAITTGEVTVYLPLTSLILNGANSTDGSSYQWEQIDGPTGLTIQNPDRAVAEATDTIRAGTYVFKLTVTDNAKLKSTAKLKIHVKQHENNFPVANAGGDKTIILPCKLVALDGSKSTDDHSIISYHWKRDPHSLAAGNIVNAADHRAVLQVVNLVAGHYAFTLTVVDSEGLSDSDSASIIVKDDPHKENLMEIFIDSDLKHFTEENKANLAGQLSLLLPKSTLNGDTSVNIQDIEEDRASGHLKVTFYAFDSSKNSKSVRNGDETIKVLKRKLSDSSILDYKVFSTDTVVCHNNCSGHGHCDQQSKRCVCQAFWMENTISKKFFKGESNCEWSILYVIIVSFVLVLSVVGLVSAVIYCCRRKRCRCRWKSKKRHRYSLLKEIDDDEDDIEMLPKAKIQNSSVMLSESDFSSEEETLFVNSKKSNGHIKPINGISKQHLRTKLKA